MANMKTSEGGSLEGDYAPKFKDTDLSQIQNEMDLGIRAINQYVSTYAKKDAAEKRKEKEANEEKERSTGLELP